MLVIVQVPKRPMAPIERFRFVARAVRSLQRVMFSLILQWRAFINVSSFERMRSSRSHRTSVPSAKASSCPGISSSSKTTLLIAINKHIYRTCPTTPALDQISHWGLALGIYPSAPTPISMTEARSAPFAIWSSAPSGMFKGRRLFLGSSVISHVKLAGKWMAEKSWAI